MTLDDFVTLLLYAIPPLLLVSGHSITAYILARRTSPGIALCGIVTLTIITTVLWVGTAAAFAYSSAECCGGLPARQRFYGDLYTWTIGLPFNLCYVAPDLEKVLGVEGCTSAHYLVLPLSLFVLGLLPLLFLTRTHSTP